MTQTQNPKPQAPLPPGVTLSGVHKLKPAAPSGGHRSSVLAQLTLARDRGVPLVAIATPDPGATIEAVVDRVGAAPCLSWDVVRGLVGLNEAGRIERARLVPDNGYDPTVGASAKAIEICGGMTEGAVLFVHMANRWLTCPVTVQALWLARDAFKRNHRMVILLGPSIEPPPEIGGDMLIIDEPLPGASELRSILDAQVSAVGHAMAEPPPGDVRDRAVESLHGLSSFQAEQVVAMSIMRSGILLDSIWQRKCRQISLTPGLSVFKDGQSFDQVAGVHAIKDFLKRILAGADRPNAIVFIDEIEKMLAGSGGGGDTSGVSQDQLGQLLSYMQDEQATGLLFVGPPGSAKSMVAKAAGVEAGVPTIRLDLGAAKGSLVGQSEQQVRNALKVITSVSCGRSLWIATCNSISDLPPELRRRFTLGTWFFDLPDEVERMSIWKLYLRQYAHSIAVGPIDSTGWTGAEIKQCCEIAWRLGCSIDEAAQFVVPISRSAPEQLARLRAAATGRFLSASRGGVYAPPSAELAASGQRRVDLGGAV